MTNSVKMQKELTIRCLLAKVTADRNIRHIISYNKKKEKEYQKF